MDEDSPKVEETEYVPERVNGKFAKGVSGNPDGRPKGSKNRVTVLKLFAEEAVRSRNLDKMQAVADKVVQEALAGDAACMKLVWDSIISKGTVDDRAQAAERVSINITGTAPPVIGTEIEADEAEIIEASPREAKADPGPNDEDKEETK